MYNDYCILFNDLARDLSNKKLEEISFKQTSGYKAISQYDSDIEKLADNRTLVYDLAIPGNRTDKLFFVESNADISFNRFYKDGDKLYFLISRDTKILYEESVNRKELCSFLLLAKQNLSELLSVDPYLNYKDGQLMTSFFISAIMDKFFKPSKALMIKMSKDDRMPFFVEEDNKVYENIFNLLNGTGNMITEGRVLRAYKDGMINVYSSNFLQARYVQPMQNSGN